MQVIINFLSNSLKFSETGSKIIVYLKMLENQVLRDNQAVINLQQNQKL